MSIGERIQQLRKANNLSQEELAEKIDVSKQSVSKWELDKALPNIEKLLKLCEVFSVTTDYLIRGEERMDESDGQLESEGKNKDEKQEESFNTEEVRAFKRYRKHKWIFMIAAVVVSSVCMLLLLSGVCKVVILNNMQIGQEAAQEVVYVDHIYNQWTVADVTYVNDDNEFITKTVCLDNHGIHEGDWIFGYSDAENNRKFRIQYSQGTCFVILGVFVICLLLSVWSLLILLKHVKKSKRVFFTVLSVYVLLCCIVVCTCIFGRTATRVETLDTMESVHKYVPDDPVENSPEDFYCERKETSQLSASGEKIIFTVPQGLYSTTIKEYGDYAYEIFWNEDRLETYVVTFSDIHTYANIDDYVAEKRLELESDYSDDVQITSYDETTESGNVVKVIRGCEEIDGDWNIRIFAGMLLPSGKLFEVSVDTIQSDKNAVGFDKIHDFFDGV